MTRLLVPLAVLLLLAPPSLAGVRVEVVEGVPNKPTWDFKPAPPVERYEEPAFGLVAAPKKFSPKGIVLDRSNPFLVRAAATVALPAGEYRVLLRSRNAARLSLDGKVIAETGFIKANASGHEEVPPVPAAREAGLQPPAVGHQEKLVTLTLDGAAHEFRAEAFVGGQKLRAELGELVVAVARPGEPFRLLAETPAVPLTEDGWAKYAEGRRVWHERRDRVNRHAAGAGEAKYWRDRHDIARREWAGKPAPQPPAVSPKAPVHNDIDRFIGHALEARGETPAPLTDDYAFLRRVTLDVTGRVPTPAEIDAFVKDRRPDRRARAIDRLLDDPRWADHWVGYWQDVLAENPGILKPTLNNTGPFRWWLHQAFLDNLPMDRFATELVMMEGSPLGGGPAGFSLATENDAPMAAKGHVLARAFLGVETQCARCHDAPSHPFKQQDLFSLAALLARGPYAVPATSTVRVPEGARKPRVEVTLAPGTKVAPAWPFPDLAPADPPDGVLRKPDDARERLAAVLTSPRNERFAQVLVNRLWKRYLGLGLVEPVDDWNGEAPSHPDLLAALARELMTHDYDLKYVARLILNSHTYQRAVRPDGSQQVAAASERSFAAPARRRLSAEQLVDSLFQVAGKEFGCEELTMDPEGRRPPTEMITLGRPRRSWEMTSLSNERDRPALALPVAQGLVDVLIAYGWRDSRQNPTTAREETATALQPLVLANGVVGARVTRLCDDSAFTALCLEDRPLPELVEVVFLRVLSRPPRPEERTLFIDLLKPGYGDRCVPGAPAAKKRATTTTVSWANHLSPEATTIKIELERQARAGDPPTARLKAAWRERAEDMVWALVNSPEFLFVP